MTVSRSRMMVSIATVLSAVAVSLAPAQAEPRHQNFTGTWVLDIAKSESSSFTPAAATYAIRHSGDSLVVDRETTTAAGDVVKAHTVYGTDGKAWKNSLPLVGQNLESSSILSWDKDALVIRSTSQSGEAELVQVDTWTLSADGQTLIMKRAVSYGGQEMGSPTWVLIRKP